MWSILWQDVDVYEWVFIVILCVNIHPFTIQSGSYSKFINCPARGFQGHSPSKHCLSNCSDTPPAGKPTLRVLIFHYRATWTWKWIAGHNRNVKKLREMKVTGDDDGRESVMRGRKCLQKKQMLHRNFQNRSQDV